MHRFPCRVDWLLLLALRHDDLACELSPWAGPDYHQSVVSRMDVREFFVCGMSYESQSQCVGI